MAIYRFRVAFEDYDDVYRDIEIKSSQTFKDLHNAIQSAISFDNKHAASFFVSDDYWRKGMEITLLEEDLEEGVKLMEKVKIVSCVEDPHQHFVYVCDKVVIWSFHVELTKIVKDEPTGNFPACVKSIGAAPKQYKPTTLIKDENLTPENAMANLLQEMNDEDAYKVAADKPEEIIDIDEAKAIGGEEGEEETAEGFGEEEGEGDDAEGDGFGHEEHGEEEH